MNVGKKDERELHMEERISLKTPREEGEDHVARMHGPAGDPTEVGQQQPRGNCGVCCGGPLTQNKAYLLERQLKLLNRKWLQKGGT